jgi:hypothetical protein
MPPYWILTLGPASFSQKLHFGITTLKTRMEENKCGTLGYIF